MEVQKKTLREFLLLQGTKYNLLWRHKEQVVKPFWCENTCFLTSFNNKSKFCGHNHAKCLSMCYFSCKAHKKLIISRGFNLISSFLVKPKMATIVGDVTGLQHRHHPFNKPHLVKKVKGFPLKVKSFRNTATYKKLRGGVTSSPPPSPLVPRWGYEFACTSEGLNYVLAIYFYHS